MVFQIGDKYYHEDIESGQIVEISKKTYEELNSFRLAIENRLGSELKSKGSIQIFSTPADDFDNRNDYYSLWKEWNNHE